METADGFILTRLIDYPSHRDWVENLDGDIVCTVRAVPGCFGGMDGNPSVCSKRIHVRRNLLELLLYCMYDPSTGETVLRSFTPESLVRYTHERGYRWDITRVREALAWLEETGFLILDGKEVTIDLAPLSVDHRDIPTDDTVKPKPRRITDTDTVKPKRLMPASEIKADAVRAHGMGIRWDLSWLEQALFDR